MTSLRALCRYAYETHGQFLSKQNDFEVMRKAKAIMFPRTHTWSFAFINFNFFSWLSPLLAYDKKKFLGYHPYIQGRYQISPAKSCDQAQNEMGVHLILLDRGRIIYGNPCYGLPVFLVPRRPSELEITELYT